MVDVIVPSVGESISEVQIGQWLKSEGDFVREGEDLVEIETEKASMPIPAIASGILKKILKKAEEFATVGDVIASIEPADAPAASSSPAPAAAKPASQPTAAAPVSTPTPAPAESAGDSFVMPAAQRLIDELGLDPKQIPASGPRRSFVERRRAAICFAASSSRDANHRSHGNGAGTKYASSATCCRSIKWFIGVDVSRTQ